MALVTAYTVSTLSAPYLAALTSLAPSTDSVDGRGAHNRTGSIAVRETGGNFILFARDGKIIVLSPQTCNGN